MADNNENTQTQKAKIEFPTEKTLLQALKLSIKFTKPIDTYFFLDSLKGKCKIVNDGEDSILYKNDDEHTSPILKLFKSENSYIVITNHTIYLISGNTQIIKVNE